MKAPKSLLNWNNNETSQIKQLTVNTQGHIITLIVWLSESLCLISYQGSFVKTDLHNREAVGLFMFLFCLNLLFWLNMCFFFCLNLLFWLSTMSKTLDYTPYIIIIFIDVDTIVQIWLKSNKVSNCSLTVPWAQIYIYIYVCVCVCVHILS